ncbi:MAG: ABC transporter substrate-binding protein [Hyphomicrobiales bacterium]|nr:MAG: ABC transporter substrate-binding protein [Hyphomicrobiales bacterium]
MTHKLTLIAGAIAAFTTAQAALAQEPVTWWYEAANPEQQAALGEFMIDKFNAANPEHVLTIDYRGNELDRQLRIALLSGTGPDVVNTPGPSFVATMARAGQLMPLDDIAAEMGWNDRILPFFMDLGRFDGHLYALPKTYETLGLFYNKALFTENGWTPPTTLAELDTLAEAMMAKDIIPFGSGNSGWRPSNEWQVSIALNSIAGPDNVQKALKGELPWTAEPFVKAINALDGWWDKGYFGPDYFSLNGEQVMANLADGTAGMAPTGTWNFGIVPEYFKGRFEDVGFVGFPSGEGVSYPIYALGIGSTFSISAKAQNPEGAAKVIDQVFSENFYTDINNVWQGEWNVPLRDLSNLKLSDDVIPLYSSAMANLASAVNENQYGYTTWTFMPPATNSYLVSGIEEVWLDSLTTEDFLAEMDKIFQQELAEGKVAEIPAR